MRGHSRAKWNRSGVGSSPVLPPRRDLLAVWTATVLGLLYVLYKRFRKNEKAQEPQLARVRKKATKPSRAEKAGR